MHVANRPTWTKPTIYRKKAANAGTEVWKAKRVVVNLQKKKKPMTSCLSKQQQCSNEIKWRYDPCTCWTFLSNNNVGVNLVPRVLPLLSRGRERTLGTRLFWCTKLIFFFFFLTTNFCRKKKLSKLIKGFYCIWVLINLNLKSFYREILARSKQVARILLSTLWQ